MCIWKAPWTRTVGRPHDKTHLLSVAALSYPGGSDSTTILKQLFPLSRYIFSNKRIQLVLTFLNRKKCCDDKFTIFRVIYALFLPILRLLSLAKWVVYRNSPLQLSRYRADIHIAWTLKSLFLIVELADALNGKLLLSNKSNKTRNRNVEAD